MLNIFEQPWLMVIVAVIALIVIWIFRAVLPEKRRWWQWVLPLLIAAAGFGADALVKTDTELIKKLIITCSKAASDEDSDTIETFIAENYRDSFHYNKDRLMDHCRTVLSPPLIKKIIVRGIMIEISPQKTTTKAAFTARVLFDEQSFIYQDKREIMAQVKLDLQKEPDKTWLINRAEIQLMLGTIKADWKDVQTEASDWGF